MQNERTTDSQIRSIEYNLGDRIAYLRKRKDWSQSELADKAEVSQSTIAQIEADKKDPSVATLIKIAQALEIHPAVLFAGNDVHVFDMKRMRLKYDNVSTLNGTLYRAVGEVVRYAKEIGFNT